MRLNQTSTAAFLSATTLLFALATARAQQTPAPQQSQHDCSTQDENGKTIVYKGCNIPPEPGAPAAAAPDTNAVPAAKRFPFPGEQPDAPTTAAPDAKPSPLQDAGSSGSAPPPDTSSSSSSDPQGGSVGPLADAPDDDEAAKAAAARKSARHKLPPIARQSPDERVAEDLQIASFYMDDKNYRGAYGRATDAVAIAADDPNTQFALAEAARKLGKLDEALTHYKLCLTLDPIPKVKKSAEKAIKDMSGAGGPSLMP
jgi:hypothetical protein